MQSSQEKLKTATASFQGDPCLTSQTSQVAVSWNSKPFNIQPIPNKSLEKPSLWDKPFNCYLFQPGIKQLYFEEIDCTLVVDIDCTMYPVFRFQLGKVVRHSDSVCRPALLLLYDLGVLALAPVELTAHKQNRQSSLPWIHDVELVSRSKSRLAW